jgi:ribosomal protein S18 acetylase RimI-like enzyme
MDAVEVIRIGEIDRSERIRTGYKVSEGNLQRMEVIWDSPAWGMEEDGEYTVGSMVKFCRDHLERNARLFGAFDGENLVGIGLIQHGIGEGMAQLAFLHVSNGYRRYGIGGRIAGELIREAKKGGASRMYVSATPSGSAVGFYMSLGFKLTDTPLPELIEIEPEDIHMTMDIC